MRIFIATTVIQNQNCLLSLGFWVIDNLLYHQAMGLFSIPFLLVEILYIQAAIV